MIALRDAKATKLFFFSLKKSGMESFIVILFVPLVYLTLVAREF